MHICLIIGSTETTETCANYLAFSSLRLLANFTKPLRYSNSLGIFRIVSKGIDVILPFKKWVKILDLEVLISFPNFLGVIASSYLDPPSFLQPQESPLDSFFLELLFQKKHYFLLHTTSLIMPM